MGMSSVDELRGKTDYDITTPEEVEGFRADDRAVMASGQARINFEEHQTRPDGTEGWLRTSKVPLVYEPDNRIVGVLGVYENITDLKLAEQERMRLQEQIIEAQRQALQELSTPIIPIMDGIIVLPLVGSIDTQRARDITRTLLGGISQYRARVAIIDITGVPVVDTGVAQHLNNTIQAARLKGARTIITGISDAVAETIIDLGIDWKGIETLRDLQNGLLVALRQLGYELCQIKS
jgi:rsbT co-antagonist protein RsbR